MEEDPSLEPRARAAPAPHFIRNIWKIQEFTRLSLPNTLFYKYEEEESR